MQETPIQAAIHARAESRKFAQRQPMRKAIYQIHLWLGISLGLYIFVMSVSGTALVFRDEIAVALSPKLSVSTANKPASYEEIVTTARSYSSGFEPTWIHNLQRPELPLEIILVNGAQQKTILLDPYKNKVISEKNLVLQFLIDLHTNLLNGKNGRILNGVGGIVLLTLALSGLFLWWRGIANVTRGFKIKFNSDLKKIAWDTHNAVGAAALPFVLIWGTSAIYFGFPEQLTSLFAAKAAPTQATTPPNVFTNELVTLDSIIENASDAAKHNRDFVWLHLPVNSAAPVQVWFKENDSNLHDSYIKVFVDHKTGAVQKTVVESASSGSERFFNFLTHLHFGSFLGVFSKVTWVIVGLTPALLFISGAIVWLSRRRRAAVATR